MSRRVAPRAMQRRPARAARVAHHHFRAGESRKRLLAVFVISIVLFLAVLAKVALLQTTNADTLRAAGKAQSTTESLLKADRGTIFARDGGELAISVPASTLIANPKLVSDPVGTAGLLQQFLQLPSTREQALVNAFNAKDRSFVYVARQIDPDLAKTVIGLHLPGIDMISEDRRMLPAGSIGRSIIGHTDPDGLGTAGLELQYNDMLRGVDGERVREHDRQGRSIPGSDSTTTAAVPGSDLVLTLDRSLQYQVEQALVARVTQLSAKGGTAIIMDTHTGEIYAMANVSRGADGVVTVTMANLAAVDAYEPGSVAKVFSLAAAIDQGKVTPDTTFNVPGTMTFDKGTPYEKTIADAFPHNTEPMTVRDIITESSNIGTLMTAQTLEPEQFGSYLQSFGFGKKTALNFPGESGGLLKPASKWQGTEKVTVAYGYGYSATPVQLIAGVNTVANGGVYVAPKLVKATIDAKGHFVKTPPSPTHVVVSPQTAATMTSMMIDVVCRGTAVKAQIPGISVAGKTGTGYKAQANGTYVNDDGTRAYFATFVGYLPAANPQVTILVSIDEPDPSSQDRFGGTAAAPLFADLARASMNELQIAPAPGDTGCPKK